MEKQPEAKGAKETPGNCCAAVTEAQMITVVDGDKTPHDELMKLPKAQIVRSMAVPENRTRFLVDVDNRSNLGKGIIGLMERLRDGDAAVTKSVTEILGALAGLAPKKRPQKK